MSDCTTCNFFKDSNCMRLPPTYVGYDCNSPVCQECKRYPDFPEGQFDCSIIFDHYKKFETVSCNECPEKDSCKYVVLKCDGRLTDICFLSTIKKKVTSKEETVLKSQVEDVIDDVEIVKQVESVERVEMTIQSQKILNECRRFCDVDKCQPCAYLLTRTCVGFPRSDLCMDCPRLLNCVPCKFAFKRDDIKTIYADSDSSIDLSDTGAEKEADAGAVVPPGDVKDAGGGSGISISPGMDDVIDASLYVCKYYSERKETVDPEPPPVKVRLTPKVRDK